MIGSCKQNGVELFACIKALITAVATGHPRVRMDDLSPWNFPKASAVAT